MGHIFVSYAREDRDRVSVLRSALEQHGLNVWVDDRLTAGAHYDLEIEQALVEADKVIVAWSPAAAASQWVRAEAGEGSERGVLIPVLIEPTRIPLEFRRVQTLDLTTWEGDSASPILADLLAALKGEQTARGTHPSQVSHRRSAPRAVDISAEVLGASKYFGNFRLKLQIGSKSFSIRHTNKGIYQVVKVDGRVVSRGSFGFLHDHHTFALTDAGGEHQADLFLQGEPSSGLTGLVLNVGGRAHWRPFVYVHDRYTYSLRVGRRA